MEERKRFILPVSWNMKPGFQIVFIVIILAAVGFGTYKFMPTNKTGGGSSGKGFFSKSADLRGGFNNFSGFAPGIWINGGLKANKESRMYKEYDLLFEALIFDKMSVMYDALKNGELDFVFTTTDISPISMDRSSDLATMSVAQFLKIDDSRGADLFIVDESIKTIPDLRGRTIGCALGWPSNTLLHNTLEAGGLTEKDVIIKPFDDPALARAAYVSGQVDAVVVWSPDDIECLRSRPSRVLTSTEYMPNIIMDGFVARKEVLEKKHDEFVKLSKAWLTANSEMKIEANMTAAAQVFKVAFNSPDPVNAIVDGMKKIHFATYGDNLNFFGLSTDFTGITGQTLYNKMARVYKNGYGNNLKDIVPWANASYPGIVQAITGLTGDVHAAEGQVKFTPSQKDINAPAIAIKPVIINFESGSWILSPDMKDKLDREVGPFANEFAGMKMRVEGNTDADGDANFNKELSYKRAKSVVDYLVSSYKFDRNRFIIVGNGEEKPVSDNSTENGKAANRRTEFQLLGK
ncbi:MAG: phosphate ABC transporter substrate-binding/OmpA family protein [Candidatus Absconditicoccaceae bacterium]